VTTWEGRGQMIRPVRDAPGLARPDWELFAGLGVALGGDLGFETLDELHEEMGRLLAPREPAPAPATRAAATTPPAGLTLFTYPLLVDEGRLSERAGELKAALGEDAFVEVHPDDAAAAGLTDGGRATITTEAGEAELPVRVTDGVAAGSVFVPFNQPGLAANTLLSGSFVTGVALAAIETAADNDREAESEEVPA
jgi:predicted molibdopterin-dependent oxidoreductase YjgC